MVNTPAILETVAALRRWTAAQRQAGRRIALVPTMGALHDGHIALVQRALKDADVVIVSIFVNPSQFAPHEDFARYPRTWDADLEKLTAAGAHAIYHPDADTMYPSGFASAVSVGGPSAGLESDVRPHFFGGVATVVAKLFLQVQADVAVFGEKDYQQLLVVRRMARDLDIPVEIVGVPTARDANGVALSSRNVYLSVAEYEVAAQLNKVLGSMAARVKAGDDLTSIAADGRAALDRAGFNGVDYLEIRDAETLAVPVDTKPMHILAAVRVGATRLIDNMPASR